ncbi:RNB-domain-containing protein [Lophium mytilinum]|uniref:RNB-domain-containing protein n=1 Tax=Lophium mytilinum TaxID=390894 RepID=A0A6A6Q7C3_9PEZI|nr:RNB-domain-containing protein [Lophium mytilinum]
MSIPTIQIPRTTQLSTVCRSCIIEQRRKTQPIRTLTSLPFHSRPARDSPSEDPSQSESRSAACDEAPADIAGDVEELKNTIPEWARKERSSNRQEAAGGRDYIFRPIPGDPHVAHPLFLPPDGSSRRRFGKISVDSQVKHSIRNIPAPPRIQLTITKIPGDVQIRHSRSSRNLVHMVDATRNYNSPPTQSIADVSRLLETWQQYPKPSFLDEDQSASAIDVQDIPNSGQLDSQAPIKGSPVRKRLRKYEARPLVRKTTLRPVVRKYDDHPVRSTVWKPEGPPRHPFRKHFLINSEDRNLSSLLSLHQAKHNRSYHTSARDSQEAVTALRTDQVPLASPDQISDNNLPIRKRLELWNEEFGVPNAEQLDPFERHPIVKGDTMNSLVKLASSNDEFREAMEEADDEREFLEDPYISSIFLNPGDVVEVSGRRAGQHKLAVYTQQIEREMQFYLMDGAYTHIPISHVKFVIPGIIDTSLIEKVLPYLPTKPVTQEASQAIAGKVDVPRDFGAPIVHTLLGLWNQSEKLYRENAAVLDNIYDSFCHPSNTIFITLESIARKLFAPRGSNQDLYEVPPALLLAIRKAIDRSGFKIYSDEKDLRRTGTYMVRPSKEVEAMQLCLDWVREYQEYLASRVAHKKVLPANSASAERHSQGAGYISKFADKARALVALSRETRQPTAHGNIGPSKERFPISDSSSAMRPKFAEDFTDADTLIIAFLESWTLASKFAKFGQLHSAAAFILNTVGCYPDDQPCDRGSGQVFLQEIGVLVPYENRLAYDEGLMLPTSRFSRQLELISKEAFTAREKPGFTDSLVSLRQDLGDTRIYCVDDPSAQEIDDGLSIARIPDSSEFWVSIHVANPTAFFDQNHVLAKLAAHMTETVYMPERNYPMMPAWATNKHFSLGPNRPALTFSARLSREGEILEKKIQPTFLRNVKYVAPDTISRYFDVEPEKDSERWIVGGTPQEVRATRKMTDELDELDLQNLDDINTLANARAQLRKDAGGLFLDQSRADVKVYESYRRSGLGWTQPSHGTARFVRGDPVIEVKPEPLLNMFNEKAALKSILVQEMMLLGCEIGAAWCSERNMPTIFRGSVRHPQSVSLKEFKRNVIDPASEKHQGVLPLGIGIKYMETMGVTVTTSKALPHVFLGMSHYAKVTSPLRRYGDMVTHWQIGAALLEEAKTGKSLVGSKNQDYLTFSEPQIKRLCTTIQPRERIISQTKEKSLRFWYAHYYFRAFYFNEAPLPESLVVKIHSHNYKNNSCWARAEDSSIPMMMDRPPNGQPEARIGDRWEVKIQEVDLYFWEVKVTPIRLIEREDETGV